MGQCSVSVIGDDSLMIVVRVPTRGVFSLLARELPPRGSTFHDWFWKRLERSRRQSLQDLMQHSLFDLDEFCDCLKLVNRARPEGNRLGPRDLRHLLTDMRKHAAKLRQERADAESAAARINAELAKNKRMKNSA